MAMEAHAALALVTMCMCIAASLVIPPIYVLQCCTLVNALDGVEIASHSLLCLVCFVCTVKALHSYVVAGLQPKKLMLLCQEEQRRIGSAAES